LWRSELRSILAGYMRRKTLTFEDATKLQAEAESLMAGSEHELDSRRVLELVRDSDCSAYDCEFAALAIALGVKLVTMDAKLQNKNAVIYGGSGAIGGAVARAFAREGAKVFLARLSRITLRRKFA